jgi:hypothetical protein
MYLAKRARVVLSSGATAPPTYALKPECGQVRMKPYSLAEGMLDDRHPRLHPRSGGHLNESRDHPVSGPRELGQELSIIVEIGSKNFRYRENHLTMKHRFG